MTQLLKCCFSFNTDIHKHNNPFELPSPQNFSGLDMVSFLELIRLPTATQFSLRRQITSGFFLINLFLICKTHCCEQCHDVYTVTISVMDFLDKDFCSKRTYFPCWFRMVFACNALFTLALHQQRKASY